MSGAGRRLTAAAVVAVTGLAAAPAAADLHNVLIEQVMTSYDGDASIQFVQMQITSDNNHCQGTGQAISQTQCVLSGIGAELAFFDAVGVQVASFTFPANTPVGQNGRMFLVATANFTGLAGAPAPNFVMPAALAPRDGKVCYRNRPGAVFIVNLCLAYGDFIGFNEFGAPAPAPPGIGSVSLQRVGFLGSNALDFARATARPCNNAKVCRTLPLPPVARLEDFAGGVLAPGRWTGVEWTSTVTVANTESVRRVESGQARLALTTIGPEVPGDTGIAGHGYHRLRLSAPALAGGPVVTRVAARITVVAAEAVDCPANLPAANATRAAAELVGHFFNDGSAPGTPPSDLTGDVVARIGLERNARAGMRVAAAVQRCADPRCATLAGVVSRTFDQTWTFGTPHVVALQWDAAGDRFIATAGPAGGALESRILAYTGVADVAPPKLRQARDLGVRTLVPNCGAGARLASIDARFDDVGLDGAAVQAIALAE